MNLHHLSDAALLRSTLLLTQKEREILMEVLWHLKEIDTRKLYSDVKCSSLFDYCLTVLKYSEGQASRRISAMRLLKELPQMAPQIEKGDLNLTQLNQIKGFFDEMKVKDKTEKQEIINQAIGRTTREIEQMLWELRGNTTPKKATIIIKQETYDELKLIQRMRSHKCPDMDSLLSEMSVEVSKIWDPTISKRPTRSANPSKRYVSVETKALIWKRDQARCRQCGGTSRLEIDHIYPFAMGGKTEPNNLRLLCRNCNQRAGIKAFGQKFKYSRGVKKRSPLLEGATRGEIIDDRRVGS